MPSRTELPEQLHDPLKPDPILFRLVFHRILTVGTPMGRRARQAMISRGGPLIRVKPADLDAAGVERAPRVTDVRDGKPLLDDGRVLDVANVIWCTGFHPGLAWVDLPKPVYGDDGEPVHDRGIVPGEPGFYFVGRKRSTKCVLRAGPSPSDAERRRSRDGENGRSADAPPGGAVAGQRAIGGEVRTGSAVRAAGIQAGPTAAGRRDRSGFRWLGELIGPIWARGGRRPAHPGGRHGPDATRCHGSVSTLTLMAI